MQLPEAPWKSEDWQGWRAQLSGPPTKLILICILQASLLIIGVILGVGRAECEVSIHGGSDVGIDCDHCRQHPYVSWQQVVLLLVGFTVIAIGVSAAIFRSKKLCRIYGLIMMVYAFVIGLTSLLTGLDTIVLSSAIEKVPLTNVSCIEMAESMISTYRINAILYALNCLLDCAGAIWSIKSKELFEFQEIAKHHNDFQKTMDL